jgi:vacuolar-type H+-ATPase subunit I/STV1
MGMKETPGSLQAYFLIVGLLSGAANLSGLKDAHGAIIAGIVTGLAVSVGFFLAGLRIKAELPKGAKSILNLLVFVMILDAIQLALVLATAGTGSTMALAVAGISILIAVYLYANVKRLAAEAQSKPA